ncbi:MAG: acyl-CoA carboxylase subunit epsilon [Candidatus Nanopelagicales bacterium]|nr:acyl-CoA carboxylase subunit epsilon [Candidatus Nanopelagicales bacterium]
MRIVGGSPTADEIGVIVTLLAARSKAQRSSTPPVSLWANKARLTRPSLSAGPGAWRASAMPR